ncbi:unnamed protein product (macronuclear) [Paramecium tetraurelia]|uniref:Chromosome undetermined scaffold_132, whole genome shotgun sequence n=1 Tax=Paramecium tetraurelia TaxID=5888 RepID=Q3SDT9_PARTE|nr:uncharacterized protein GSPATT00032734001 [Paramecium tetraurelia]CAI39269.1 rab_C89 [Paramecium tetraurelia]CAK62882.1 unnamed protein product [Paramecium tetraurelia]|eukprot:XP_001430280.1 hypothetical protein (macronuclear) [Paramecium tetraurelia strain d4-2]
MQSLQKKVVNIVIIGDQGAGKTTLFKQVTTGQFTPEYYSTIGVDVGIKEISIEGFQYHLQFWDTSGQERFQAIIQSYYRRAECCVIVYDLIDPEDYKNVKHWMKQFSFRCDLDPEQKFPFVIVGTHLDKLTEVQKQNLDPSDNIQSFQISLKDDNSVQQIIQAIINCAVLEQHNKIKYQEKAKSNPICQKFTNQINNDLEKLNDIMTLVQSSKKQVVETYDQLINNVGTWQKELKDLKQFYNSPTFVKQIESSNFSEELFFEQESISFNDKIQQVNQSNSEKSEMNLKDFSNVLEEATKLKGEFNQKKNQINKEK